MSWNLDLKIVIFKVLLLEVNNCHLLRSIKTLSIFYGLDVDEREIKKSQFFLILLIGCMKSDLIFLLVLCFGFCFVFGSKLSCHKSTILKCAGASDGGSFKAGRGGRLSS